MRYQPVAAIASLSLAAAPPSAACAEPAVDQTAEPETITVIGTTPLPGTGIDIDKVPGNPQTLSAGDLARSGSPSVIGALADQLGSININDNLDDPFQPDILYRGFEASPVLGTPQGLAVYQNGVRINEAFGDAVNWDLFPDIAIDRLDLVSANPVYGLNALGGAVVLAMKNGFSDEGSDVELSGGSFGRRSVTAEFGANSGMFGAYLAARVLDEQGWREFSPNSLRQLYGDFSVRSGKLSLDLSYTGADNRLFGQSSTPVQELAINRELVFTNPQDNFNQLNFLTLNGAYSLADTLSIQGDVYYRAFRQSVANGNTTDFTACTEGADIGFLCQSDGLTPATTATGALIPDLSKGGTIPIGENDFESIHSSGLGGTVQATSTAAIDGHDNSFSVGGSIDRAGTGFESTTEIGAVNASLQVGFSGFFVDTPENTPFNATPVDLGATNTAYGAYLTDTFNVTPELAVTASGRWNLAEIDLADRLGTDLSGRNRYSRFNPALGAAYKIRSNLTAYAGYSETNRTPTASEIECSNPLVPCLLPSSLASDPPSLKQVVAYTYETGVRGKLSVPDLGDGRVSWNLSLFRTDVEDDIYGVATSLSTGFFQNIGSTRREGAELGTRYSDDTLSVFANYSYVDASFQSALTLNSPQNPFADAAGNIPVKPGDLLPGIPRHRLKLGLDYHIQPEWVVGATLTVVGDEFYRGDESNQLAPLPGYAVTNLHSTYQITPELQLFGLIDNVFNAQYANFGVLGDPTGVGAPGIPAGAVTNGPGVDNRFQSPAPPLALFGGVRVKF
jgi:iron complex outermembrane receptor protein